MAPLGSLANLELLVVQFGKDRFVDEVPKQNDPPVGVGRFGRGFDALNRVFLVIIGKHDGETSPGRNRVHHIVHRDPTKRESGFANACTL